MAEPKVTVVIPAYNADRWIDGTLESVKSQSFGDWEIVVIDDGSNDDTVERVLASQIPSLRLVSQANQGPTAARNRGFQEARGEYVALLDADDRYEPEFLERTVNCLDKNPDFGFVATNQYRADRDGTRSIEFKQSSGFPSGPQPDEVDYCQVRLRERGFPSNTAMVLRRALIKDLGGYDPTIVAGEELELVLRWTCATKLGYISDPLVTYFDRPGSFIKDLERSIRERVHLWKIVLQVDSKYQESNAGYAVVRNMCLFRIAAVAVAAGYFDEVKEIEDLWPSGPRDRFWWAGQTLTRLPLGLKKILHFSLGRSKAIRYRNDPGQMQMMKDHHR